MAARLPLLVPDTSGHRVAVTSLVRSTGVGMVYQDGEDAADLLADRNRLDPVRSVVRERRLDFTFDRHVDGLLELFRLTIGRAAA
jgi:hypothetical protein